MCTAEVYRKVMRLKGLSVGVELITVALTKSFMEPGQKC